METLTVTVEEQHIALVDELSDDGGPYKNRSEATRNIISQYTDTEELRRENDRLRRELRAANARQDDVGELVEYVERERSLQERREERERKREERRDAPVWRRAKWWLLGRSE